MVCVIDRGLIKVRNKLKSVVIEHVYSAKGYKSRTKKRDDAIVNSLNCVIHNTFNSYCIGLKKKGVTLRPYSFSNNIVNGVKISNKVSYTYTLLVLDALEDLGYIVLTKGGTCVLPVFDEVIIEWEFEDKLKEVMEMAYESVLGFTDNCYIVKEK